MNKIVIVDDKTSEKKLNDNIEYHIETYDSLFSITNVKIEISGEETLYFYLRATDKKYKIQVDINSDVCSNIYIFENVENSKVQYSFTVLEKSNLNVKHYNKNINSKQMIESNLIGEDSSFNYQIRKICHNKETNDFYIHHCGNNSYSNLTGDIASLTGASVSTQISTFVEEECIGANTTQSLNILKFNDSKTELKPNLYIDNNSAIISHDNNILNISDFVENDFMLSEIYDKDLREALTSFIERIGVVEDE